MKENKTFLVTGATGLIGSRIVSRLLDMGGARVIALSRDGFKLEKIFGRYTGSGVLECIAKDVGAGLDLTSISPGYPIDAIFHAASPMSGRVIGERPVDVIKPNLTALMSVLEGLAIQRERTGVNGRALIFSSVTAYYGTNAHDDITVTELDTRCAESLDSANAVYSESKRMAEVIARAYVRQFGVDAVIARLSTVYGAAPFPPETALFEFIGNALSGKDVRLKSSGLPRRDNIYVDDAVSALFTILEKGTAGEAYNVSSGGKLGNFAAVDEIAEIIAGISNEELSGKIKVIYEAPPVEFRQPGIIMNNNKLESLGWKLDTGLRDGLKNTILKQKKYGACH